MNQIVILGFLAWILVFIMLFYYWNKDNDKNDNVDWHNDFDSFAKTHGKSYANEISKGEHNASPETKKRYEAYKASVKRINAHNEGNHHWVAETNQFSDMTPEEFKRRIIPSGYGPVEDTFLKERQGDQACTPIEDSPANRAKAIDWRTKLSNGKHILTPVKNQLPCGTCYCQAAAEGIESAWVIDEDKSLTKFSPQQLLDCTPGVWQSNGLERNTCMGGTIGDVVNLVNMEGGIAHNSIYPYTCPWDSKLPNCADPSKGCCKPDPKSPPSIAQDCKTRYGDNKIVQNDTHNGTHNFQPMTVTLDPVVPFNEQAILDKLQERPVEVWVDADGWGMDYKGGILTKHPKEASGTGQHYCNDPAHISHAVQIVGWQPAKGSDPAYWIIKNSWGGGAAGDKGGTKDGVQVSMNNWGMDGYAYVSSECNTCGIATLPEVISVSAKVEKYKCTDDNGCEKCSKHDTNCSTLAGCMSICPYELRKNWGCMGRTSTGFNCVPRPPGSGMTIGDCKTQCGWECKNGTCVKTEGGKIPWKSSPACHCDPVTR